MLGATLLASGCARSSVATADAPASAASPAATNCEGLDAIDEVWTRQRREQLATQLSRQAGQWPKIAVDTLVSRVEAGREDWRARYAAACEAGRPEVLSCLELSLWDLDGLIDVLLSGPPARAASLWSEVDLSLVDLGSCERAEPPPELLPPELGQELAELSLLVNFEAAAAAERVEALAAEPRVAEHTSHSLRVMSLELRVALAKDDEAAVDDVLGRMRVAAARVSAEDAGTRASMAMFEALVALSRGQLQEAARSIEDGLTPARTQGDAWVQLKSLHMFALFYLNSDHEAAKRLLGEVIALSTQVAGAESPHTADVQHTLGELYMKAGEPELAYEPLRKARDVMAASLGIDHPFTLLIAKQTFNVLIDLGREEEAFYAASSLLQVHEDLYGDNHPDTAEVQAMLANLLFKRGELEQARELLRAAVEPLTAAKGAGDPSVIGLVSHLGGVELELGNVGEAEAHCSKALRLALSLAEDHPARIDAENCMVAVRMTKANEAR